MTDKSSNFFGDVQPSLNEQSIHQKNSRREKLKQIKNERHIKEKLDIAEKAETNNNFILAIQIYSALFKETNHSYFIVLKGLAEAKNNNAHQGIEDFTTAINMDGYLQNVLFFRAQLKEEVNDIEGALNDYKMILEHDPQNLEALENTLLIHKYDLNIQSMLFFANKILLLDSQNNLALNALNEKKDLERKLRHKEILTQPLIKALNQSAKLATNNDDYDLACSLYLDAFNKTQHSYFLIEKGNIEKLKKNYQQAILDFDKSLELEGFLASTLLSRASTKELNGDISGALDDYHQILQYNPNDVDALEEIMLIHQKFTDKPNMVKFANRILAIDPDNTLALKIRSLS